MIVEPVAKPRCFETTCAVFAGPGVRRKFLEVESAVFRPSRGSALLGACGCARASKAQEPTKIDLLLALGAGAGATRHGPRDGRRTHKKARSKLHAVHTTHTNRRAPHLRLCSSLFAW